MQRCRIRFGLRSLFVVVTIASVYCAMLAFHYREARSIQLLEQNGVDVFTCVRKPTWLDCAAFDFHPEFVIRMSFDEFKQPISDVELGCLQSFSRIVLLDISSATITESGCAHLSDLSWLENLQAIDAVFQRSEAIQWHNFTKLTSVCASGSSINDQDLERMAAAPQLEELFLESSPITDRGLKQVERMKNLRILWLSGSHVSAEACESLFKSRDWEDFRCDFFE